MKKLLLSTLVFVFLAPSAFARRAMNFQSSYAQRFIGDRLQVFLMVNNFSGITQTVRLDGFIRVLGVPAPHNHNVGDIMGSFLCGTSQASPGVTAAGNNFFAIPSGGAMLCNLNQTPQLPDIGAGGAGTIEGVVEVLEDEGHIHLTGTSSSVQLCNDNNYPCAPGNLNHVFKEVIINGGRPL